MVLQTPVVFIIFNRPELTKVVFQAIANEKPKTLLIVADGPRNKEESKKCLETRKIVEKINWPCDVYTDYSVVNLGCKRRISSGLDWAFSHVDKAIILEDDCLPNPSFFGFCDFLLNYYRHDERIMMISGTNLLEDWKFDTSSYIFSYYGSVWGWATWRRAWKKYDVDIKLWKNQNVKTDIRNFFVDEEVFRERAEKFDDVFEGNIDTWDYQWTFCRLINCGLAITPTLNLVANLGFGEDATHTLDSKSPVANLCTHHLDFPLRHPLTFIPDSKYLDAVLNKTRPRASLKRRIKDKVKKIIGFRHIP